MCLVTTKTNFKKVTQKNQNNNYGKYSGTILAMFIYFKFYLIILIVLSYYKSYALFQEKGHTLHPLFTSSLAWRSS